MRTQRPHPKIIGRKFWHLFLCSAMQNIFEKYFEKKANKILITQVKYCHNANYVWWDRP